MQKFAAIWHSLNAGKRAPREAMAGLIAGLRPRLGDVAAVLLLASLFAVVFGAAEREPIGSDDCSYFEYAGGTPAGSQHHQQRYALLGSVWLSQAFFATPKAAYYAVPFVYGLGLVLASYALSRFFMGTLFAFVAALMVLLLPDFLRNATVLMPDVPVQFWLVSGLCLFLKAFTAKANSFPRGWVFGSALCFFLSAATKESVIVALVGLIAFPLAQLRSKRAWLVFAAVSGGVLALELLQTLALWIAFGDPLHRIHAVTSGHVPQMELYARTPGAMPDQIDWGHLSTRFVDQLAEDKSYQAGLAGLGFGTLLLASVPVASIAGVWQRQRLLLALGGFILTAYVTLTFTVVSLDPLIPMVRTKGRYFLVVLTLLPTFVMAGWSIALEWPLARPAPKRWIRIKRGLMLLVSAVYAWAAIAAGTHFLSHSPQTVKNGHTPVADTGRAVVAYIARNGPVQRVLGPKKIRGGAILWDQDFEIIGRKWTHLRSRKLQKHDLLLAEQDPAPIVASGDVSWQRVGRAGRAALYYFSAWNEAHASGRHHLLALEKRQLKGKKSVRVRLKLRARGGARPQALRLVKHQKGKPLTLQLMKWQRKSGDYVIDDTSAPFRPLRIDQLSLEVVTKGRGSFQLIERDVRLIGRRDSDGR